MVPIKLFTITITVKLAQCLKILILPTLIIHCSSSPISGHLGSKAPQPLSFTPLCIPWFINHPPSFLFCSFLILTFPCSLIFETPLFLPVLSFIHPSFPLFVSFILSMLLSICLYSTSICLSCLSFITQTLFRQFRASSNSLFQ